MVKVTNTSGFHAGQSAFPAEESQGVTHQGAPARNSRSNRSNWNFKGVCSVLIRHVFQVHQDQGGLKIGGEVLQSPLYRLIDTPFGENRLRVCRSTRCSEALGLDRSLEFLSRGRNPVRFGAGTRRAKEVMQNG